MPVRGHSPPAVAADPIDEWIDWKEAMTRFSYRLTDAYRRLDDAIRSEQRRSLPNPLRLLRLQALKLAVKRRLRGRLVARPTA
jgi:hypothetical protein